MFTQMDTYKNTTNLLHLKKKKKKKPTILLLIVT